MDYEDDSQSISDGAYAGVEVHNWQPPCSCGVSLDDIV